MATDYRNILVKRGSADQWAASTLPLMSGEWGLDETNRIVKMGDGFNVWADLPAVGEAELLFDPETGLYAPTSGDPIPSVDVDHQMPSAVRERLAANLSDPATPEGLAAAAIIGLPGPKGDPGDGLAGVTTADVDTLSGWKLPFTDTDDNIAFGIRSDDTFWAPGVPYVGPNEPPAHTAGDIWFRRNDDGTIDPLIWED